MQDHKHRIEQLRAYLVQHKLDGFFVPHEDAHLGEYIPPKCDRLQWLTGFSGSAGLAIILKTQAVLFVDGRYTLQAAYQVDKNIFEIADLSQETILAWLQKSLLPSAQLGFDPWLHSVTQIRLWQERLKKTKINMVSLEENPLSLTKIAETICPPEPQKILAYPTKYAGKTTQEKLDEILAMLTKQEASVAILTARESIAWLLNIRGYDLEYTPAVDAYAGIDQKGSINLFIDLNKVSLDQLETFQGIVEIQPLPSFADYLKGLGQFKRKVLIDPLTQPYAVYNYLATNGAHIIEGEDPVLLAKACKNETELRGMRQAHIRDGVALCKFLCWFETALTEHETLTEVSIAEKLESLRQQQDLFFGLSFPTIAGFQANGAIVHYHAEAETAAQIIPEGLLLLDSGAQYWDGTTDVTRTLACGTPSAHHKTCYTLVLKGHIALAKQLFPIGTSGAQLDVLARQFLWQKHFDYAHGTGHGVGCFLAVHEGPQRISKAGSKIALMPGMVLSNEPGYYEAGHFGIRLENLVIVQPANPEDDNGFYQFETLTVVPFERGLIDLELLTEEESQWVNAYHQHVWDTLHKLVDEPTKLWLKEKTKPL